MDIGEKVDPIDPPLYRKRYRVARWVHGREVNAVLWIRIRIRNRTGSGFNGVPGSLFGSRRAKMTNKRRKSLKKFIFCCVRCTHLRAEGFCCSLDISKMEFLIKKDILKNQLYFLLPFLGIKTLDPDWIRIHLKCFINSDRQL
jgi:hypothetical protein